MSKATPNNASPRDVEGQQLPNNKADQRAMTMGRPSPINTALTNDVKKQPLTATTASSTGYSPSINTASSVQFTPATSVGSVYSPSIWSDGAGTVLPVPRTEHYAGKVTVVKVTVPVDASSPDYEDPIETCQEWKRDRAIEGSLWSCEGETLKGRDTETIRQLEAAAETALPRH